MSRRQKYKIKNLQAELRAALKEAEMWKKAHQESQGRACRLANENADIKIAVLEHQRGMAPQQRAGDYDLYEVLTPGISTIKGD